jgi:hypothetical protein
MSPPFPSEPQMADVDRYEVLRTLDARYDELARELDRLNERIEAALTATGAGTTAPATATVAGPGARSC